MKLYICYGTFTHGPLGPVWPHACEVAYSALREAGHDPEVIKSYGLGVLPDPIFNRSKARREVKRLAGSSMVPLLITDDGQVIHESKPIAEWAKANAASSSAAS